MAYAQKYLFRWDSSNGTTREIRILKDGYTGSVLQRALGRAPILKKQQSGPVCGTSLEIYAECLVDGEFAEFYVTDPKAYRVELYEGARLLWTGFVTPELYAEPDIAPPYDVQITATDGVGELKLYGYQAQGTRSLRQIFTYLLSYTGVGTDLQLISSLRVDGGGAGELLDKYINLDYLSGKTCYDALTYLLTTLHATITRWGGAWIICRETNVTLQDGAVQCFALDGGPVSLHDSVKTLGKLSVNEIWPVGQLTQKVEPAKRSVTVQAPWNTVGCTKLLNSDMMEDAAWIKASGATYDTDRQRYKAPQLPHFPNQVVKLPTIYQSFEMDGLRVPMAFCAWFTAAFFISPIDSNIIDNRRLTVLITYTVGDTVYHLRSGAMGPIWMPGDAVDAENIREDKMTLDVKADAVAYDADRVSAQELRIDNIPTLGSGESHPAGTLTIYLIGECVYIYGASLEAQLPKGYQDRLHLANGARGEGDTVEVAFGRVIADASYYKEFLSGVLLDGDKIVTAYQDAVLTEPTDYLSFISRDYARSLALPRLKRTGVVYLERSVHYPPLVLSKGAVDYWLETWSWNLYEDELDITAKSLPIAVIEVESEVISESSEGSASSGSSSSSSSSITTSGGASFFERGDSNEVRLRASYELLTAPALSLGQTFNERPSLLTYDPDSDAWHLSGNLLVDGFVTAGGKGDSSSGGGSADYTQWGWDDIIQLTSDPGLGNLASAWALKQEYDSRQSALSVLSQGVTAIRLLIPSSASESNQLADKEFVNSSIASNTATFRGTFEGVSYLPSGAKLNDYAFVIATDASGNPEYNRYKYTASGWVFEYTLNNSSFTAEQWSAITSGITANLVSLYSEHIANQSNPHAVTKAQIGLGDVENIKLSKWQGSTSITTLGTVTTGEWNASKITNDYLVNSAIRIGSTTVALGGAIEALSGIASISLKGDNDAKLTFDNGAWHLSGNLLVDGYITAGGVGSSSGGGGIDSAAMWALLGDATGEQINKTHISSALEGYQTIIPDLATIRGNAANGNTAYWWGNHASAGYLTGITKSMVEGVLTGNITSHTHSYLPLSGGEMSGTIYCHHLANSKSAIKFRDGGIWDSGIAHDTKDDETLFLWAKNRVTRLRWNAGIDFSTFSAGSMMNITPDFEISKASGTATGYIGGNAILHSNNYNSYAPKLDGTGANGTWPISITGDSDTVDGYHASDFAASNHTHSYAASSSAGGPALSLLTNGNSQGGDSCYDENTGLHFYKYNGDNNTIGGGDGFILQWSWGEGSVGQQLYLDDNPTGIIGIRGYENGTFTGWSKILTSSNYNSYSPTLIGGGASGTWGISITGNAASATQLQTSRTIWGQSFNGTGNVSGDLMGAGGYIDFQYSDEINRYGGNLYLQNRYGTVGSGTGGKNTGNLYLCFNGGNIYACEKDGNVGIGTHSPSEKLDVNGAIRMSSTGNVTSGLYPNNKITNGGEATTLWLYNDTRLHLYGTTIELRNNTVVDGNLTAIGTVAPSADKTYTLGTASAYWDDFYVKGVIHAYHYNKAADQPFIVFDKPGNYYVGIGPDGTTNRIKFGPVSDLTSSNPAWVAQGTFSANEWYFQGNILATGAITAGTASDSRLKRNIATLCNASSVLRQLRGVGFDWNALATDKNSYFRGHDVGLIAQEVEPLIPSAIGTIWGEYKRLDYAKITPYLVEGWKEHDNEIDRLRKRVLELESEVNRMRKYVN